MRSKALAILLALICLVSVQADDDDDTLEATNVLLFLFFGLGIGILVMQALSYCGDPVPHTVVVFFMGMFFSLADSHHGSFGKSVGEWVNINADLMLFVFLPPLVFGEAMYLNWYHVRGGLIQSLLMAGPGVVFGAVLMGTFAKLLLPYGWAWNFSMMFGSILSATDTVAVVSLLKSVGASPKLTILIVGESLLNDGSAMVLFTIFFNSVNGELYNAGSVFEFVFSAAFGSLALGAAIGLLTVRWLRSANRPLVETDTTIQIAVTICSAYLTFFIAQNTLEISGVLACCSAGAMVAWLGPPIILNHESMHNVWGMIEWCLNTAIFLLAGLIIGNRILSKASPSVPSAPLPPLQCPLMPSQVNAVDWIYMVIFYLVLMAVRFLTVLLLFPLISTIGHGCTPREAAFMSWAGLRGALGMALALIVENNLPDDISDECRRLFFYVGGIATLTLLINATTAKTVLEKLGLLNTDSPEKALVTSQIKRKLQRKTERFLKEVAKEFNFSEADVDEVRMSCTLCSDVGTPMPSNAAAILSDAMAINPMGPRDDSSLSADASASRSARRSTDFSQSQASRNFNVSMLKVKHMSRLLSATREQSMMIPELVFYVRSIFLEIVRVKYWHCIESGKLPRQGFSAQFLLYSVDVGLDHVSDHGGAKDWTCLSEQLDWTPWLIRLLDKYQAIMPASMTGWSSKMLGRVMSVKEKREVYMLSAFIEAHEHAQERIHAFLGLGGVVDEDEEHRPGTDIERGTGESDEMPCPEEQAVVHESKKAVTAAKARLAAMNVTTVAAIKSKQASRLVLAKQAELVKNMVDEGLLTAKHAEVFLEEISHDTQRIEKERNIMYKEHTLKRGQEVQAEKEERGSSITQRPHFLNQMTGPPSAGTSRSSKKLEALSISSGTSHSVDMEHSTSSSFSV